MSDEPFTCFDGIGARIVKRRNELDLSQAKLARMADMSGETLRKVELGTRPNPRVQTLAKLCKPLGVDLHWLVFGKLWTGPGLAKNRRRQ